MKILLSIAVAVLATLMAPAVRAQPIDVLSAGAVEPGIVAAASQYRKETGTEVKVRFATAPAIRKQMSEGATADVVIAPPPVLEELAKTGKVDGSTRAPIGKVGVGVAARANASAPDISSTEALKKSVSDAESIVFNRASTGLYMDKLFEKLGLTEAVKAKEKRYATGEQVMEHLLKGSGREFGFGAQTEIVLFKDKGLRLIGALPAEVQNFTTYVAAPLASAPNAKGAAAFLAFLAKPETRKIFAERGVE